MITDRLNIFVVIVTSISSNVNSGENLDATIELKRANEDDWYVVKTCVFQLALKTDSSDFANPQIRDIVL